MTVDLGDFSDGQPLGKTRRISKLHVQKSLLLILRRRFRIISQTHIPLGSWQTKRLKVLQTGWVVSHTSPLHCNVGHRKTRRNPTPHK